MTDPDFSERLDMRDRVEAAKAGLPGCQNPRLLSYMPPCDVASRVAALHQGTVTRAFPRQDRDNQRIGTSGQARELDAASVSGCDCTQSGDEWPGLGGGCGECVRVHLYTVIEQSGSK